MTNDLGEARHTTYGAARATVFLAVLAAACLYFRRPLGACAGRLRRLPALLAGLKGRLEAPTEELQSLNPNAAGLELQSPEPSGATGRASPAERRASARLARSMRSPASTKAAAVSPAAASAAHATPEQAGQAGQEGNGWDDDDKGWGDDSNGWGDDNENGWGNDNDWGETTSSPTAPSPAGRV